VHSQRFYVETLGCPKNEVDSEKIIGVLQRDGLERTDDPAGADVVVVNTCAFIVDARRESIDTILALADRKKDGARLVVTGCMAERYGDELAAELPEVDQVAGFGVPVALGRKPVGLPVTAAPAFDLLNLPREDRRGLRQVVWLLCDPILPWSAAQSRCRVDPARGR
jgi:ribosomal protein S12 methylthiotransferase